MINGEIDNTLGTVVWLVAGGAVASWYGARREEARHVLYGPEEPKPSAEEAQDIRRRLIVDAFLGAGAWLALFLVLDWLF